MNHQSKDTHHCCSSVVQFYSPLLHEFFVSALPLEHTISQITREFTFTQVFHDENLKESNESDNLEETSGGDVTESSDSRLDGSKGCSREVNISRNTSSERGVDVSKNSKHGNTSVLDLDIAEAIESFLIGTVKEVQWIPLKEINFSLDVRTGGTKNARTVQNGIANVPETQRFLDAKSILECSQRGGCTGLLLRGKGGGSASEESKSSNSLHGEIETIDNGFEKDGSVQHLT